MNKHKLALRAAMQTGIMMQRTAKFDIFESMLLKYMHQDFTFLQIGANDGVRFDPLSKYIEIMGMKGVMVEPESKNYTELCEKYRDNEDIRIYKYAISKAAGKVKLYKAETTSENTPNWVNGMASLKRSHLDQLRGMDLEIVEEVVESVTIMQLLKMANIANVDLLLVDAEGSDYEIISNIDYSCFKPKIIYYEHNRHAGTMTAEEHNSLLELLYKNSYKVYIDKNDCIAHL